MRIAQRELDALGVAPVTAPSARSLRHLRRDVVVAEAAVATVAQQLATANPTQATTNSLLGKRELDSLGVADVPEASVRSERRLRRQRRRAETAAQDLARRAAQQQTLTCVACMEQYPARDSVRFGTCENPSGHCRGCLQNWLASRIGEAGRTDDIRCPCNMPRCEGYATHETVHQHATAQDFEVFDTLQTQEVLREMPGYRACPSAACRSGQIHDNNDGNIFKCGACGHRHCTNCNVPFHDGESCEQRKSRKKMENMSKTEQEKASQAKVDSISATCPGCGARINKNGGCDHMTCRLCRTEFCYLCSAPYSGSQGIHKVGNTAHKPHCKYHC
ncbi:hypothetical protein IQ06DRAFT_309748 [Phaeosphaeriaceae sp. SRC1lsM3a]|nr:hypothetical protein IQ06DRAFT_309748 [Stagonospora sp. SRC1lsM3a]